MNVYILGYEFILQLKNTLPSKVKHMNHGNVVCPVSKNGNFWTPHQPGDLIENVNVEFHTVLLQLERKGNCCNIYLEKVVKKIFTLSILKTTGYDVANQFGLALWKCKKRICQEEPDSFNEIPLRYLKWFCGLETTPYPSAHFEHKFLQDVVVSKTRVRPSSSEVFLRQDSVLGKRTATVMLVFWFCIWEIKNSINFLQPYQVLWFGHGPGHHSGD